MKYIKEPGTDAQIKEFVKQYGVTFDMFSKIDVNGADAIPLYQYLKSTIGGGDISWNFTKFLIDKNGIPVKRYAPIVEPDSFENDIIHYLKQ
jgi:glutathione peroxidase-family protein